MQLLLVMLMMMMVVAVMQEERFSAFSPRLPIHPKLPLWATHAPVYHLPSLQVTHKARTAVPRKLPRGWLPLPPPPLQNPAIIDVPCEKQHPSRCSRPPPTPSHLNNPGDRKGRPPSQGQQRPGSCQEAGPQCEVAAGRKDGIGAGTGGAL